MNNINAYLVDFFNNLLMISFMSSILIIAILLVKALFKNKLSIKTHYALWFLVLIRLICPYTPQSPISVYGLMNSNATSTAKTVSDKFSVYQRWGAGNTIVTSDKSKKLNAATDKKFKYTNTQHSNSSSESILLYEICFFIWLLGFILAIGRFILMEVIFSKQIKKGQIITNGDIYDVFIDCKKVLNINKKVSLIYTKHVKGPALYGVFHPKILLPLDILEKIEDKQIKYVFMHELIHLKNKDQIINISTVILTSLHWFNPIIRIAFNNMREEREIMCDGKVLLRLGNKNANEYGKVIVRLMESTFEMRKVPMLTGIISYNLKRRIVMIKMFEKNKYKWSALGVAVVVMVGGLFMTTAKANEGNDSDASYYNAIVDKIDYQFVNDDSVIGTWGTVGFVKDINNFKPGQKDVTNGSALRQINFLDNGKMETAYCGHPFKSQDWVTWTKNIIINSKAKTASKYTIKEIDGKQYMFYEWKSGDYIYDHLKPYYYVLEKGYINNDNENDKNKQVIFDNVDYPFVDDANVKGEWESVDFVDKMDDFNPDKKSIYTNLPLQKLTFDSDGHLKIKFEGETCKNPAVTWTKDMVLDKGESTANKYTIKEINGQTYMFFEWKTSDYTVNKKKPGYYVLKKEN
jgi:bla regulator protein BlaR1